MKPNYRQDKLSAFFQMEMSNILNQIFTSYGVIITVVKVLLSKDYKHMVTYLSISPKEKASEIFEKIQKQKSLIKKEFARRVRHTIRFIPEVTFQKDTTLDLIVKIDELLKNNQ